MKDSFVASANVSSLWFASVCGFNGEIRANSLIIKGYFSRLYSSPSLLDGGVFLWRNRNASGNRNARGTLASYISRTQAKAHPKNC